MSFNLIIFDCDGTLVDSEYLNNLAVAELFAEEGLPAFTVDVIASRFTGHRFSQITEIVSRETGHVFAPDASKRYVERARSLIPVHQETVEGAADLIRTASSIAKICVASNGQRDNVFASLEFAGLLPLFDESRIFTGLDVKNAKPAPDLFLMAAEKCGVIPEKTLVIEDSIVGATAGVAAGMTTFGFTGTAHDKAAHSKALAQIGVHKIFDALIHIRDEITG